MQFRKRAAIYSGLIVALALVLSAALLQLTQIGAQAAVPAKPLAQQNGPLEFSITIVKDAVPDSTQPFTFSVYIQSVIDATAQALPTFELIDDGTGLSNTATITEPAIEVAQTLVSISEYPVDGWLPTDVACEDETGTPITPPRLPGRIQAAEVTPGIEVYVSFPITAGKQYTCTFTNGAPAITLDKTVGTDPAACATTDEITVPAGSDVTYCYEVENTGGLSLTLHSLVDDQLSSILNDFLYILEPGASTFVTQTATPPATVTNVATWTASMTYTYVMPALAASLAVDEQIPIGEVYTLTAVATDTATVNIEPPVPSISVTKTVGTVDGVCAPNSSIEVEAGTTVYYCYTVQNTGNVPLPLHDLEDSDLGTILSGLNYTLTPGSSVNTVAAGVTVSKTLDVAVTNVATWTAYVDESVTAQSVTAVDSATVTMAPLNIDVEPQPSGPRLYLPQIGK